MAAPLPRPCKNAPECEKTITSGANLECHRCRSKERTCACGNVFRHLSTKCWKCDYKIRSKERTCECGNVFTSTRTKCFPCQYKASPAIRFCVDVNSRKRRARKAGAMSDGSVTAAQIEALRAPGICAYCGASGARDTDHIIPLDRGGPDCMDNLVLACKKCNCSKGAKQLTEWDPVRVAYAIEHSEKVHRAYEMLTQELAAA